MMENPGLSVDVIHFPQLVLALFETVPQLVPGKSDGLRDIKRVTPGSSTRVVLALPVNWPSTKPPCPLPPRVTSTHPVVSLLIALASEVSSVSDAGSSDVPPVPPRAPGVDMVGFHGSTLSAVDDAMA
jgi:hypothetical protein